MDIASSLGRGRRCEINSNVGHLGAEVITLEFYSARTASLLFGLRLSLVLVSALFLSFRRWLVNV